MHLEKGPSRGSATPQRGDDKREDGLLHSDVQSKKRSMNTENKTRDLFALERWRGGAGVEKEGDWGGR